MVCIYCEGQLEVINSRRQKRNNQVWRRRRCKQCLAVFTTHEAIDAGQALRVEARNGMEDFMPDKLYTEILLALQDRKNPYKDAREITSTIINRLLKTDETPVFTPSQISRQAAIVLRHFDKRCWLRFQAEHPSVISS